MRNVGFRTTQVPEIVQAHFLRFNGLFEYA